jgi:hypothetical protein
MSKPNLLEILDIEPAVVKDGRISDVDKKMVCLLMALGEPAEAVARKVGLSKTDVDRIVQTGDGLEQIIRFQTAAFPDPLARVKRMAHMALDTQQKLLIRSKSDATIAKVASDILDRATGKATQVIENRNLNVNVTDQASADRAIRATQERIERLELVQRKLQAAKAVTT